MADRPRYTDAQLAEYFDRVVLPDHHRFFSVESVSDTDKLGYLERLQKHQLIKVPFENLTLHYSWHRVIDTNQQHLFNKIVHQPGRGGYCMEVNTFFHTVLLSLGFSVFLAGARVYDPASKKYGGFTHCVNIVQIADTKYLVDVGFGANGPSRPVPLAAGREITNIAPASMRLVYEPIPQNVNQDCRLWIYQQRNARQADWVPMYCFVDFEFLPEDIRAMNWAPWRSPTSFFTQKMLVTRVTTDVEVDGGVGPGSASEMAASGGNIDGVLIIDHDKLKWRRNGETWLEISFSSDNERVMALRNYFGIELQDEDVQAIRGTVGYIRGAS